MPIGWQTFVYQTDVTPEKFSGFFYDTAAAEKWVKKQEGTFEVSDVPPTVRIPKKEKKSESPSGA